MAKKTQQKFIVVKKKSSTIVICPNCDLETEVPSSFSSIAKNKLFAAQCKLCKYTNFLEFDAPAKKKRIVN